MTGNDKTAAICVSAVILGIIFFIAMITYYKKEVLRIEAIMIENGMTAAELKCIRYYAVECPREE